MCHVNRLSLVYDYVHTYNISDVNECPEDNECEQVCVVTKSSFECQCQSGYHLESNGVNCTG